MLAEHMQMLSQFGGSVTSMICRSEGKLVKDLIAMSMTAFNY